MSERPETSGPQFRAGRPSEPGTVRTTIVGGRPPGGGRSLGDVPRGIEVLVKKASIDPEFKKLLLERRADAAGEIGLVLDPAEKAMLAAVPSGQLEAIIGQTTVPEEHRRVFLGKIAAAMLAAVGLTAVGCSGERGPDPAGIAPDPPDEEPGNPEEKAEKQQSVVRGIRPDRPDGEPDQPQEKVEKAQSVVRGTRPDRIGVTEGIRPDSGSDGAD